MRVELITQRAEFDRLGPAWNALLAEDCACPQGMDATSTHEWAGALIDAFLDDDQWMILVASDGQGVCGILPLYWVKYGGTAPDSDALAILTELNGGRNGLLVRTGSVDTLNAMLDHLARQVPGWDRLLFRTTLGGRSDRMLDELVGSHGRRVVSSEETTSPYLILPDDLDQYLRALSQNFRKETQRRERRLRDMGTLDLKLVEGAADTEELWDAILEIEKTSWKETAGSSITAKEREQRFYPALLPRAAAAGQLLAGLLLLDQRPIAYCLAIRFGDTAIGLKTSYVEDLSSHSPATVLRRLYFDALAQRGVRAYDFMGACEPHKMRWTETTYSVALFSVFNSGLRGAVARLRHQAKARLRHGLLRA